jgi:poly(hydroxyalkanoate) depolymerase family esterase
LKPNRIHRFLRNAFAGAALVVFPAASCLESDPSGGDEAVGEAVGALGQGTFAEVTGFGTNPGALKMFAYVPSPAPPAGAPLVLALHACSQDATIYRSTGWEELADAHGFYVVYPEQQTVNNALRCFNWAGEYGNVANMTRGQGENQSIKEMVDAMVAQHGVDPSRVFAVGHSGGGAMVALLMSVWPDVFSAGGIMAGIPYDCTKQFFEVSSCLSPGKDLTPEQWGMKAKAGYPGYAGPWPRLSVWHGTNDTLVKPLNQKELIEQWSNVHGIPATPTATSTVDGHTRHELADARGNVLIESYEIQGGDHGTFVDPESGCGAVGSYILDYDICAAARMAEFFGITGGSTGNGGGGAGGAGSGPSATSAAATTGTAGPDDVACVAGRQKPCSCPDGSESFKTCAADGSEYGECDCPEEERELSSCSFEPATGRVSAAWALLLSAAAVVHTRRRNPRRPVDRKQV